MNAAQDSGSSSAAVLAKLAVPVSLDRRPRRSTQAGGPVPQMNGSGRPVRNSRGSCFDGQMENCSSASTTLSSWTTTGRLHG
jgi:hypothetical protein